MIAISFDVQGQKPRLINRGDAFADYSIANALIKGNFQDPIMWPGVNENVETELNERDSRNDFKLPQSH